MQRVFTTSARGRMTGVGPKFKLGRDGGLPVLVATANCNKWIAVENDEATQLDYRVSNSPEYADLRNEFTRQRGDNGIHAWIIIYTQQKHERLMYFRGLYTKDAQTFARFSASPPVRDDVCRNPKQHRGSFVLGIKPDGESTPTIRISNRDKLFTQLLDAVSLHTLTVDPIVFFYMGRSLRIGAICNVTHGPCNVTCELRHIRTIKATVEQRETDSPPSKRAKTQEGSSATHTCPAENVALTATAAEPPAAAHCAAPAPDPPDAVVPGSRGRGCFQSPMRDTISVDTSAIAGYVYVMKVVADDEVFYYAGSSAEADSVPPRRIQAHVRGEGCTHLIPRHIATNCRGAPQLIHLESVAAQAGVTAQHALGVAENNKVLQLFEAHGSRNVRGGVWCTVPFGTRLADAPLNLARSMRGLTYKTGQVFGARSQ